MDNYGYFAILFLLSAILVMAFPLLFSFFRSRNDKVLDRREKVLVCVANVILWTVINFFLGNASALPAIFWSVVAYFLMTPVYEHTPSKH